MADRRFRWTRSRYRKAHTLARSLCRLDMDCYTPPEIVRRYLELWERHQQHDDPLATTTLRQRHWWRLDSVPF